MVYFQCCTNFCRVTQSYMYVHFLSCIIFHPVLSQETGPKNSHFVDLRVGPVMLNSMCTEQIIHALGISQIKLFFKLQRTGLIYCSSFWIALGEMRVVKKFLDRHRKSVKKKNHQICEYWAAAFPSVVALHIAFGELSGFYNFSSYSLYPFFFLEDLCLAAWRQIAPPPCI